MQSIIFEALPVAILVGAEAFAFGFGGAWLALSGLVEKPLWLAAGLVVGSIAGAAATFAMVRQAIKVAQSAGDQRTETDARV